jgi:hypothetical protein
MSDNTNTLNPAADILAPRLINGCRQQFEHVGRQLDDSRRVVEDLRRAVAAADQHALMLGEVSQAIAELCGHLDAASERLARIGELLPPAVSYDLAEMADWLAELAAERCAQGRGLTIGYYEPLAAKRYPGIRRSELLDAAKQARQRIRK